MTHADEAETLMQDILDVLEGKPAVLVGAALGAVVARWCVFLSEDGSAFDDFSALVRDLIRFQNRGGLDA